MWPTPEWQKTTGMHLIRNSQRTWNITVPTLDLDFWKKSLAGLMEFYVDIVTSFYYYDKPYISKTFAILAALICTLQLL